jgi:hypothetical protein
MQSLPSAGPQDSFSAVAGVWQLKILIAARPGLLELLKLTHASTAGLHELEPLTKGATRSMPSQGAGVQYQKRLLRTLFKQDRNPDEVIEVGHPRDSLMLVKRASI